METIEIPEKMYHGAGRAVAFIENGKIIRLEREGDLSADLTDVAVEARIQMWVNEGGFEGVCSGGKFCY